ncbi:unnamed protein product [Cyprideis torosa]|uniref:Uncharacterized protein n=1 Tax=Cyprideis torosa TaxID=163714 RepID=A0A7R8WHR7_9CRUS|nr:unnamed protein product [Cyprideis torosa]CAG0899796.1 unnamed protein product [Cyprideis torosa]
MRPTLFCALFLALGAITSAVAPLTREELLDQLEELGWWDIPRDDLPLPALMLRDSQEHQNRQKTQGKAEAEICYEDLNLGCFSTIEGPLQYLGLLPKSPEWIGTKFRLYNALQENDTYAEFDFYNMSTALENDFFLGSDRTVFFITHGFNGSPDQSYYANYASDLRRLYPESNIFVMDWEKGAASINYPQDIANGALVGRQGALLISRLVMDYGFNASQDLHMIGHSLGGQIMNYVSNWLLELTGQLPARITATDPADPLFYDQGQLAWSHLDPDDAHFVEVIHTDCGPLITLAVGVPMEIGHLDFYPNGGVMQPGCISWLEEVINMILGIPSNSTSCNHGRSNVLLYDSDPENDCQFTTFPCDGIENFEQVLTSPDITVNCGGNCGQIGYDSKGSGRHCLLTFSPDEGLCAYLTLKIPPYSLEEKTLKPRAKEMHVLQFLAEGGAPSRGTNEL